MRKFVIISIAVLVLFFILGPFVYKAVSGDYPPGFPLRDSEKSIDKSPVGKKEEVQIGSGNLEELSRLTLEEIREREITGSEYYWVNWFSEEEIEESKNLFERNYPQKIKSVLEPSPTYLTEVLDKKSNVDGLKEMGVNTVSIFVQYDYENGYRLIPPPGGKPSDSESEIKSWIMKAKAHGFAVELSVITGNPTNSIQGDDPDLFLQKTKRTRIKWAEVAEDYGVEYYNPFSEFEGWYSLIKSGNPEPSDKDFVFVNKWERDLLPEIRNVFSGKLVYKVADPIPAGATAAGFDYYGVDFSPNNRATLSENEDFFSKNYEHMQQVAGRDGVDWIVGEFWVHHSCFGGDKPGSFRYCPSREISHDQVKEYYESALSKFVAIDDVRKGGFVFDAYVFPAQKIRGTPSEDVVKEWFKKF